MVGLRTVANEVSGLGKLPKKSPERAVGLRRFG